jgi:hypothetical protein
VYFVRPNTLLLCILAGNVGNMSATCSRHVKILPIFAQNACQCQHKNSPDTEFCVGFLATLYLIPRSYIHTNTHTKNLHTHKDPLPLPKILTRLFYLLLLLNDGFRCCRCCCRLGCCRQHHCHHRPCCHCRHCRHCRCCCHRPHCHCHCRHCCH